MEKEIARIIKDIKAVKIQGAREIAKAGLRALEIITKKSRAKTAKVFISELERTAMAIIKTRPTEPGLRHMLSAILTKVNGFKTLDVNKLRRFTSTGIKIVLDELNEALEKIAANGAEIIKSGDVIMTHCHSHSVVAILRKAKQEGKEFKVIVTETRPLYQGIMTAKDLLKVGIPIIYSEDSAMGHFMKITTKVLVGCDAILPDGSIVNKIGTLPMAIVARQFGKPFYVVGGTIKFTQKVTLEFRSAKEIIKPKKLPKAKIINPAFDITPAEFIDWIITEKGPIKPVMVKKLLT